ncbi:MAG: LamG-like jellyroll fold domain-containing protein [Limisphaerales bacterium]
MKKSFLLAPLAALLSVATAMAQSSAYFQAMTNLNPVAYWPLQETAQPPMADVETNLGSLGAVANAYYSSTNVYKGQTGVTGDFDASVYCNGINGAFLAVPMMDSRVSVPAGPFTVEAWVNPANTSGYIGMVSQAGANPGGLNGSTGRGGWVLSQNYLAYLDSQNMHGWSFHVYNGQGAGNGQPQGGAEAGVPFNYTPGTWYYLAAVFDGTNCTLYLNGTNINSVNNGYEIPMTGSYVRDIWDPLCIGCGRGINGNRFAGGVDEVAIYTNTLTAAQVQAHYDAASAFSYSTTVLGDNPYMYWRMDNTNYPTPAVSDYPVATNYGSGDSLDGLYLSGTTPGMPGPTDSGFGSPSYACAFNGIGTDSTNEIPVYTNGILSATNLANSGIMITNLPDSLNLISNSITAMCWFKGNPADTRYQGLFGHGNGSWKLSLNTDGHVRWTAGLGGDFESAGDYNDGNWHFVVGVYDNSGMVDPNSGGWLATNSIYVDGVLDSSELVTNAAASGNTINALLGGVGDYFYSGYNNSYNQRYFSGSLAQCAYFTNALTANQIASLYTSAGATPMPPTITAQPYPYPSIRTVTGGDGTYIYEAVVAYGGSPDLGYSWYYNSASNYAGATLLTDNAKYSDSTTSQITITNLADSDSGYYFCVVNNNYGAVTSAIVDVQVNAKPVITAQNPSGAFNLFTGQSPMLSVTAVGAADLIYQWFTNGVADTTAGTNASYTLPGAQAQSGETFQCIVTNSYGSATSLVATLTEQALPASVANSSYATNILVLNPTVYYPMHEMAPAAAGDIETNYGSLGALGTGYYNDWDVNNGDPGNTLVTHEVAGALANDSNTAIGFSANHNSYLLIPHTSPATTLTPPFTIECWAKGVNNSFGDIIAQAGATLNGGGGNANKNGVRLCWGGNNLPKGSSTYQPIFQVYVGYGTGQRSFSSSAGMTIGVWHHLAVTCDTNDTFTLYVDGNNAGSATYADYVPSAWNPLLVGNGFWGNGGPARQFQGDVDEVAIYTTNLDGSTIYNHYYDGLNGSAGQYVADVTNAHPLLYYRMDSPPYIQPPTSTWPVMTNYGTAAINGVYTPGLAPGGVGGPDNGAGLFATGLSGDNAAPMNGMSAYAAAYAPDVFNVPYNAVDPSSDTPFTVSVWYKGNPSDPRVQAIVSHGTGSWELRQTAYGNVRLETSQQPAQQDDVGGPNIDDGNWHQVVATHSGTNDAIYVDGVLSATASGPQITNGPGNTAYSMCIGADPSQLDINSGVGAQYAGNICEVAFWNGTALTLDQVQTLYDASGTPPQITQQPVSATVNQNGAFTNTVAATGSHPLAYQWYKDNAPIDNQTNTSLIFNPVKAGDQGSYYVVVSNNGGSVTSAVVSLTVNSSPTITNQFPVAYTNLITLFAGANPTFSVSAVGAQPIHYQWFTNGVAVAGATNVNYTLPNAQADFTDYCVVTNVAGSVTSMVWNISVIAAPTASYPQSVLADQPIGYWRLNDPDDGSSQPDGTSDGNNGVLCHDYAGGNNGIYTNTSLGYPGYNPTNEPTETSALFGQSGISFYDSDAGQIDGIDFSATTNTSSDFTVEAWVNGYSQTYDAGIVTKGYGGGGEQFTLDTGSDGGTPSHAFRFFVRDASGAVHAVNSSIAPTYGGGWHHLVGVCDEANGYVALYIDGAAVGTTSISPGSGILASTNLMTIGSRMSTADTNNNYQFYGNIDDVAVYNYALSSSQVAAQYFSAGIPPSITQQPPASTNVDENGTLVVSAAATGTPPLFYQWYDANTSLAVPDQTNATLTINDFQTSDSYYLTVTNLYGSTNSTYVSVNVISGAPVIVQDLPPHVTTVAGRLYTYSVQATGTEPFSYQWYNSVTPIAGATNSTYTFSAAPGSYSVVITNVDGTATSTVSILTAVSTPTNSYAAAILGLNPAGYWPLQETNAPAAATIETNYGTLGALGTAYYVGTNASYLVTFGQTGALTPSGDNDNAVTFNSYNNGSPIGQGYAVVPSVSPLLALNPPFTIECWANPITSDSFGDLVSDGGTPLNSATAGVQTGIRVQWEHNPFQFSFYAGNGTGQTEVRESDTITPGGWHHVVLTCDASTNFTLYVDGINEASRYLPYVPSLWNPLTIGAGYWDWTKAASPYRGYSGGEDEVAVYTNALSPTQITNHYLSGITPGSNYVQAVENDKPLLYYRMDELGYTNTPAILCPQAVNYGSAPVNGTYVSGTLPGGVSGPQIYGLGSNSVASPINGVISCVDAGNDSAFNPTGTQPFTAMTWFRCYPSDGRVQTIMSHGVSNWAINLDGTTGRIVWNLYNGGQVTSTSVLNDGNWHFIAGVYDGTNSYLYVDGALNNSGVATGGLNAEAGVDLYLGGNADYTLVGSNQRYFAGALAQAAFFTNALSAAQIQQIYNTAAPAAPTINLTPSGSQLIINYTGTLLSSTNVVGPYTPVPSATSPYTVTPTESQMFYRTSNP